MVIRRELWPRGFATQCLGHRRPDQNEGGKGGSANDARGLPEVDTGLFFGLDFGGGIGFILRIFSYFNLPVLLWAASFAGCLIFKETAFWRFWQ